MKDALEIGIIIGVIGGLTALASGLWVGLAAAGVLLVCVFPVLRRLGERV